MMKNGWWLNEFLFLHGIFLHAFVLWRMYTCEMNSQGLAAIPTGCWQHDWKRLAWYAAAPGDTAS